MGVALELKRVVVYESKLSLYSHYFHFNIPFNPLTHINIKFVKKYVCSDIANARIETGFHMYASI